MKRFFVVFLLIMANSQAWADKSGTFGEGLTLSYVYTSADKTLRISGTGNMNIIAEDVPWVGLDLRHVVFDYGATKTGSCAFQDFQKLQDVVFPESMTNIGSHTFHNCIGLKEVELPNSLEIIGMGAFQNCMGLTDIVIPNGVVSIGSYSFSGCVGLKSIEIPSSLTNIGVGAFDGCTGIENMTVAVENTLYYSDGNCVMERDTKNLIVGCKNSLIPVDALSIGDYAFQGCVGLTDVDIPVGVKSIGNYAFRGCVGLTGYLTIPKGVTRIGHEAFSGCSALTDDLIIPDGVKEIGESAFSGCSGLTRVVIPKSVTSIGGEVFKGCTALTEVVLNEKNPPSLSFGPCSAGLNNLIPVYVPAGSLDAYRVSDWSCYNLQPFGEVILESGTCGENLTWEYDEEIKTLTINGTGMMWNYASSTPAPWNKLDIEQVVLPTGMTSIGNGAFSACSNLTKVEIPKSVTSIGDGAFEGCSNLTKIEIPKSVTSIGEGAFSGCTGVLEVLLKSEIPPTLSGGDCMAGFEESVPVYVPADNIEAYRTVGWECYNLQLGTADPDVSGTCGNGVKWEFWLSKGLLQISGDGEIKDYSVSEAAPWKNLDVKRVVIDKGVTGIGDLAFDGCVGLTTVEIPNGITKIGGRSFQNCSALEEMELPDGVVSIEAYAFYGCRALPMVDIPESVIEISNYAFWGCSGLRHVTIADGVSNIGNYAFAGCSALPAIKIPGSVNVIGRRAFEGCTALTDVDMEEGVKEIRDNAFYECVGLTTMIIPEGVTGIGNNAFEYCSALTDVWMPSSLTSIGRNTFYNCFALSKVVLDAETPPVLDGGACSIGWNYSVPIYVPTDGADKYWSSLNWGCYNIRQFDELTPVTETRTDEQRLKVRKFMLNGEMFIQKDNACFSITGSLVQ